MRKLKAESEKLKAGNRFREIEFKRDEKDNGNSNWPSALGFKLPSPASA